MTFCSRPFSFFLVVKTFPHIDPLSIDEPINMLAFIWRVEAVDSLGPQNDPYAKPKMEPSFFKVNLLREITKKIPKQLICLLSYDTSYQSLL